MTMVYSILKMKMEHQSGRANKDIAHILSHIKGWKHMFSPFYILCQWRTKHMVIPVAGQLMTFKEKDELKEGILEEMRKEKREIIRGASKDI